jgi:hypothetical protein
MHRKDFFFSAWMLYYSPFCTLVVLDLNVGEKYWKKLVKWQEFFVCH